MNASPWGGFEAGHIAFCEARVDGWIAEPANAWSSIAYVVVGAYLAMRARRIAYRPLLLVGITSTLVGLGSFVFHGTATFVGEFVDESSMFLVSALMMTFALRRVFAWDFAACARAYVALVVSAMLVLAYAHGSGVAMFGAQVVTAVGIEVTLWRRASESARAEYAALKVTLGIFAVAWAVWWVDLAKVACNPTNHVFGGHAAWHVLSAVALACYQRFQETLIAGAHAVMPSPVVASSVVEHEVDAVASVVESLRSIRVRLMSTPESTPAID